MDIANLRNGFAFHFTDEDERYRVLKSDHDKDRIVARSVHNHRVAEFLYDLLAEEDREVVID